MITMRHFRSIRAVVLTSLAIAACRHANPNTATRGDAGLYEFAQVVGGRVLSGTMLVRTDTVIVRAREVDCVPEPTARDQAVLRYSCGGGTTLVIDRVRPIANSRWEGSEATESRTLHLLRVTPSGPTRDVACVTEIEHTIRNQSDAGIEVFEVIPLETATGAQQTFLGDVAPRSTRTFRLPPKHWLRWRYAGSTGRRLPGSDQQVQVTNRCLPRTGTR